MKQMFIRGMIHLQLSVTKRGTIHLCKIGILLLDRDFEHDIYELIKAFYPEGDIHSLYEKDEEEYDIFFTCLLYTSKMCIRDRPKCCVLAGTDVI